MILNKSEQEKRNIIVNEINKNMFVEAGAGAGKSTLIVSRIIHQLKNGMNPGQIVAITFTNAATHELRERIVNAALEENKNPDLSQEQKANMKSALDNLDQMQISTIHSFCNRILTEKSLDAGLSMDISLVEEKELERMKEEAFIRWAEGLKKSDWEKLLKVVSYRGEAIAMLRKLTNQLIGIPDDMQIEVSLPLIDESTFLKQGAMIADDIEREICRIVNEIRGGSLQKIDSIPDEWLYADAVKWKLAFSEGDKLKLLQLIDKTKEKKIIKAPTKKEMKELLSQDLAYQNMKKKDLDGIVSEKVNYFTELALGLQSFIVDKYYKNLTGSVNLPSLLGGYENYVYSPYIEYACSAKEYFRKTLGTDTLTNDLLIQKTYDLLLNSEEAREFFREKFQCIYVDEFQDTDHVQDAFIRMLAETSDKSGLRDGALFVVGDPKQSIYRFRGAEPQVYFDTKNYFAGLSNAYVIELQNNYRSNEYIIEWVNNQFAKKNITKDSNYVPMQGVKLLDKKLLTDKTIYGIYSLNSPSIACEKEDRFLDIENTVSLILNLVNGGYEIVDYKNGEIFIRNIRYSDFLLLCQNTSGMEDYLEAFHQYAIPVVMDSKLKMESEWYLNVFVRTLKYMFDSYDRTSKEAAKEGFLSLGMSSDSAEQLLTQLLNHTEKMCQTGKVQYLNKHWKLFLPINTEVADYDVVTVETRITQMVEKVLQSYDGNGHALLTGFEDYLSGEVAHELILNDDVNAVRFMNLHKAKGLEGNIVVWLNRQEKGNYKKGSFRKGNLFYPSCAKGSHGYDIVVWGGYNRDEALIQEAMEEDYAEKTRLEYVAATRAKQAFIMMDCYESEALFTKDFDFGDRSLKEVVEEVEYTIPEKGFTEEEYGIDAAEDAEKEMYPPLYLSETPSRFEDNEAGRTTGVRSDQVSATGNVNLLKRPTGAIFGIVMHRTFEILIGRITCSKAFLDTYFGKEAMQMIDACWIQAVNESKKDIPEEKLDIYRSFLHEVVLAYGKWWYQNGMPAQVEAYYTELPFSYFAGKNEENIPIWRHGIVDLVLKMKDGSFVIIDYKSDSDQDYPDERSFHERLRGKYTEQIRMYQEAVVKAFSVNPEKITGMLISFSQKEVPEGEKIRVRTTQID